MYKTYKVSILVPVYGVENYIERCARSLFEQTYENIEFVFVDDCSPDNSIQELEKIIKNYPNRKGQIKIIHHEKNIGLSGARHTAINNATGDFVIHSL
jgi:glycosyltransferase involved in cell wall biosynthesis